MSPLFLPQGSRSPVRTHLFRVVPGDYRARVAAPAHSPTPRPRVPIPPAFARPASRALLLAALVALPGGCGENAPPPALSTESLVGDDTCLTCHAEFATYAATAHARSSALASTDAIDGSFFEGENLLNTSNPNLHYRMEALDGGGFRQVAVAGPAGEGEVQGEAPIDVVIGSGRKGQTYLYWRDDLLYQLPVSHWTGIGWANSPGYPDRAAVFNRPVNPRCLECHATYARDIPDPAAGNRYDPASLVTGISCESCHGAGSEHVALAGAARWWRPGGITNPAGLPRDRQIDGCALCHGGIGESLLPPFSYRPGQPLSAYLHQPAPPPDADVDVHGNQVALLARSGCFLESEMTCATCHNVHDVERDVTAFSATCISCHAPGDALPADHGQALPGNCVDCHMPNLETRVIVADDAAGVLRPRIRSHWIQVYPEISAELARAAAGG